MADEKPITQTADYSSELLAFVKQLASATGDLSKLTCPSFLLNGFSMLEYSLHWCDFPNLLFDISNKSDADQMVCILLIFSCKW
jgi:hypothetical protein